MAKKTKKAAKKASKKAAKKKKAKKAPAPAKKVAKKSPKKKKAAKKAKSKGGKAARATTKKKAKKAAKKPAKPAAGKKKDWESVQSEVNLGLVGHVDHGKTTLVKALSGEWTDRHSEEQRRGISIKLGYADTVIMKCPKCEVPDAYTTLVLANSQKPKKQKRGTCPKCGSELEFVRKISFVDAPGHEILMATMLSGASLMDGACLLVAADETCPQPQTREHLAALQMTGIEKVIIVQNKIDRVSREKAVENYHQIKEFVKGTVAEDAPVIPISAVFAANIDILIEAIEEIIPTPERDPTKPLKFYVARSFDINKPGTKPEDLQGGVIGGSVIEGVVKRGQDIEIRPGYRKPNGKYVPLTSTVESISVGKAILEEGYPGGLLGLRTRLDPAMTKGDHLIGHLAGDVGTLPDIQDQIKFKATLLSNVVGSDKQIEVTPIAMNEMLMLNVTTTTTIGVVSSVGKKGVVTMKLQRPVVTSKGDKVAISRRIENRFRLIGAGEIL
ncbi:MAG: translation initiation factor IF-2 subunit gamma [Promethearchaeota archaeon]